MSESTVVEADAPLHIELPIDSPMRSVIRAEDDFLSVIMEVSRGVTELRGEPFRWLLAHAATNGVIRLRLRAVSQNEDAVVTQLPDLANAVITGFATIERNAVRPPFFTDSALEKVRDLADLTPDIGLLRVVNGHVSTSVTSGSSEHVQEILGTRYSSVGSIEGRLEGVNLHDRRSFYVYDSLDGRRIQCEFGTRVPIEDLAKALIRRARVFVYGVVNYRSDGEIASVHADEIFVIPPDDELPTADDVRGIYGRS